MAIGSSEADTQFWPLLEQATLRVFMEIGAADSPGMVATLRHAIRYATVDDKARRIVVDTRAFVLGLLAAGRNDTPSTRYGNTSTWIAQFVAQNHSGLDSILSTAMTGTDAVLEAAGRQYVLVASSSIANTGNRARTIAQQTVSRPDADLRHFVAAQLGTVRGARELLKVVGWTASASDVARLRQNLYERIARYPEEGEDLSIWQAILQISAERGSSNSRPPDEVGRDGPSAARVARLTEVSGFTSDRPGASASEDPLELAADVTAFARLICLHDVDPPLSIGLFGGWGSGKSTFMHRLEATVDDLTKKARSKPDGPAEPTTPAFIRNAVQIRFNAWHFADANLWASLTAEFFDQLRAGGYSRSGKAIHARLVERVNNHVHQLTSEAKATRDAFAESERSVRQAQQERDAAAATATMTVGSAVSQTLVDSVVTAYDIHKADLNELRGKNTANDIIAFISLAKDVRSMSGQLFTLVKFVRARGWRAWLAVFGVVAIAVASFTVSDSDLLTEQGLLKVIAILGGFGALARSILPGISLIASVSRTTAGFATDLDEKLEVQLKNVAEKEEALKRATTESDARRAAAARATKALSRYVDPGAAAANPPRLLRYMLEDDPDTQALETEIGLISRVRRLFQAVNEIVAEEKGKKAGERDADVPDRIIIYIDDLDRCTPSQVYAVLQAVHLLLAFELFVVVVGVDVGWVEEALAHELRPSLRSLHMSVEEIEQAESEARKLATRYMEKIFQLPFWLRRLSSEGADGGSYASYVRGMLQHNLEITDDLDHGPTAEREPAVAMSYDTVLEREELSLKTANPVGPADSDETGSDLRESLATVKLTQAEVDFLASEAIGRLAGCEPRTVKRFVNIYRIIRARLDADQRAKFLGSEDAPAIFPIVAILIATETNQPLEAAENLHKIFDTHAGPLAPEIFGAEIQAAWAAAQQQRNGAQIGGDECRIWSLITRRYSFNRYH